MVAKRAETVSLRVVKFEGTVDVNATTGRLQVEASRGYVVRTVDGVTSITCLVCGSTSYNPSDVSEAYCARCQRFHEDV